MESRHDTIIRSFLLMRALIYSLVLITASVFAETTSLDLQVRHVVHGRPLLLDSLRYPDAGTNTFSVTRLSYLIGGLALEHDDGSWHELDNQFVWMDASARRTRARLFKVPTNSYRSLRFDIGLPPAINTMERAWPARHPLNPILNNLHWDWETGYIFLALEGRFRMRGERELTGYVWHLAREANRTRVNLVLPLDLHHTGELQLDFDLGHLLSLPNPIHFSKHLTSTHSHPEDPLAMSLQGNLAGSFQPRAFRSFRPAPQAPHKPPIDLPTQHTPVRLDLPLHIPRPDLPSDNPLTAERIALGKRLFSEKALSLDRSIACASCHLRKHALSDPSPTSLGIEGRSGLRNSMPLMNLAWKSRFLWDGRSPSLREQALEPLKDHAEMDLAPNKAAARLQTLDDYPSAFAAAFGSTNVTPERIGLAVENYLLTELSFNSRFDQALAGKATLTDSERRGFELFMTEFEPRSGRRGADCFHCHGGPLFTDNLFHNNGLDMESADRGLELVSGKQADRGRFVTPSLRNVALTAPYMHDGRMETLEEVVDHYDLFVQNAPNLDPNLDKRSRLDLTDDDKAALVAFLKTLTDSSFTSP